MTQGVTKELALRANPFFPLSAQADSPPERVLWKGLLVSESFAHPAKFAKGLIFRLIDHAVAEGWLHPRDTCLDPFGGVAVGGLPCLLKGINWVGVELEPRFVALGHENLAYWQQRYGHRMQGHRHGSCKGIRGSWVRCWGRRYGAW
jgi:hypothetical protein